MRNDDEDEILHTCRLLQQYAVDVYIKLKHKDWTLFCLIKICSK